MASAYHFFSEIFLENMPAEEMDKKYAEGFVITRRGRGIMQQVCSVRIRLNEFSLSSENRRIIRKHQRLTVQCAARRDFAYDWRVGKMAKDFYEQFGKGVFSANKIRMLCTSAKSPVQSVFIYSNEQQEPVGYCLAAETPHLVHYAYPFYSLTADAGTGMAMMIKAVIWAKEREKEFIYLGSVQGERSFYKFQFTGVEWFNGKRWQSGKPTREEINESTKQKSNL